MKRKPYTKAQLLPLKNAEVRALSLDVHIALATIRRGQGGPIQIGHLAKTIYVACFLRDLTPEGADIEQFRRAEHVLDQCIERAASGGTWLMPDEDYAALERIILLYDAQLEAVPVYRLAEAWDKLDRLMVNRLQLPAEAEKEAEVEFVTNAVQEQLK
ncbi:hypothetical protein [Burkholderia sp. BCC0405]|uniref:hypothetical protein n=1 Tax=Burkholderia sp. BCC0405 TaxID=2676298 RepID=UPI001589E5B3|nr:hypothetical protein [Burkholderia sp. BCC0405]